MEKASIDRFEGNLAVIIVGDEAVEKVIPKASLPRGAKEGSWLKVEFDGDRLICIEIDEEETERAKQRIAEKLKILRRNEHLKVKK